MNRFYPRLSILLLTLALGACGASHPGNGPKPANGVAAPVSVLAPAQATVYESSPGNVVATNSARIASRLTGYVQALHADVGDTVKAGQLLLTLDNRDVEAQVARARAALSQARASLADAKFNYDRYASLYKQDAVTRQQYENMKRNYAVAQAGVKAAKAQLDQANAQRAYAEVRAPFAGVVTARFVQQGDLATPGKPLMEIQSPGHLEVHTQISNSAYAALKVGDEVQVMGTGIQTTARVLRLSPAADPSTETHLLKATLPANTKLGPGDFVRVRVPVGTRKALFVPDSALVERVGIPAVFVVNKTGHAHLRMVRIGEQQHGRSEILSGLTAGERFVTHPTDALANGARIKPEQR
ncbi:MAG TPA: efflux RND transporter periplasmic adaptor subunit [Gammaproteobacteria bacterium]|nr:efflux RND transporter periplasmic adaptor subunit [Gammaproteobacteria bacterium]